MLVDERGLAGWVSRLAPPRLPTPRSNPHLIPIEFTLMQLMEWLPILLA